MDLYRELKLIVAQLEAAGIAYALCGGLAVATHGHVRATKDIDLIIVPEELDAARRALEDVGFVHSAAGQMTFKQPDGAVRSLYRLTKIEDSDFLTVDLLLASDPVLAAAWNQRQSLSLGDLTLSVLSLDGLIAMKRTSSRAIDRDDVEKLLRNAQP